MKQFLTLLVGLVATSVCYSAPTYTSYFNNTHTYTNATVVGTNFAGRGVFTNGITAGASTFTNSTSASIPLGIDAFNGMTNTPFYVKRGGSNLVDIGQHPTITGGLEALRIYANGPNNASNYFWLMDIGDDSGVSALSHLTVGFARRQYAGLYCANLVWDQTNKRFAPQDNAYTSAMVEVGQEGVSLHASAAGDTFWSSAEYELFQARPNGADGNGLPSTGYFTQSKAPLILQMEAAANASWRGTSTQPAIWIRNGNESSNLEVMRLQEHGANATGPIINIDKSRGTFTTASTVASNDFMGLVRFRGYDGSAYITCADIGGFIDNTPGVNDMPGALIFRTTADGAASPTERMRILSSGTVDFMGEITSTLGTITADASALDATATWNNGAVTFTGLKMNITDTASAAASLLMDLQLGGNPRLQIQKTGGLISWGASSAAAGGFFTALTGDTVARAALAIDTTGTPNFGFGPGNANRDTFLLRDAANTLALRNSTAAQMFNIYNTYTDASNYERVGIGWSGNQFQVGFASAGTGTATRNLAIGSAGAGAISFYTAGSTRWSISGSGHLLAGADNTYDIGAAAATRPRNVYAANSFQTDGIIQVGAAQRMNFAGRSTLASPADGILQLVNAAFTDFNRLQFGGTSSSFPALKRSSTELQVRLADDSADAPLKSGQLSNTGIRVMTPSSLQTLAAANALLANATKVRVVGSGGAVTLTSTPTIADGSDGQYVMIQGTDDTNTLTVQDQGSLASSNLELGAATRVLGAGDVLVLTFDSTASVWYEVSFANN